MEKKTYAKMIEELAAKIEEKDGTKDVLISIRTLVDITNAYLDAKQKGQKKALKAGLRETFRYFLINLG